MHKAKETVVAPCSSAEKKSKDYVRITCRFNLEKFNMAVLDKDVMGLIANRTYGVCSVCPTSASFSVRQYALTIISLVFLLQIAGSMANEEGKRLHIYLNR